MAGISESRENLLGSTHNLGRNQPVNDEVEESLLTPTEKKFLLYAERGDVATVRRWVFYKSIPKHTQKFFSRLIEEYADRPDELHINCVDPLNRSALVTAIENENIELVHTLLEKGIRVKDSLLHAIKEEYVEAVEVLLEWEEQIHVPGQPYVSFHSDLSIFARVSLIWLNGFITELGGCQPCIIRVHARHYASHFSSSYE